MTKENFREIGVGFRSGRELESKFQHLEGASGFFFHQQDHVRVGERVMLMVDVKGMDSGVLMEGSVAWRRMVARGKDMPTGFFVGLTRRDAARVGKILAYLKEHPRRTDRQCQRYSIIVPASCNMGDRSLDAETRNISLGGAFIRCPGCLPELGDEIVVTFSPGMRGLGKLRLSAQVAWLDDDYDVKGMGVEFKSGWLARRRIDSLIKANRRERVLS